jgi:tripartite-type tricarboxylate transporter receptor subunit TctC
VITRLNADFRKTLTEADVRSALDKAAIEPLGTSPADASAFVASELKKWAAVIRAAGIKVE